MRHWLSLLSCFSLFVTLALHQVLNAEIENAKFPDSYEVASLGASITGPLVEGCIGAIQRGAHQKFYGHSPTLTRGFIGSQAVAKPITMKDQPGIFPAPAMGDASISFNFISQDPSISMRPFVVRPDGTVFQGLSMAGGNAAQRLVISSPAQTGVYTLFILTEKKINKEAAALVEASISSRPRKISTSLLKKFDPSSRGGELFHAEFIYKK